jgi:hypothetical protein
MAGQTSEAGVEEKSAQEGPALTSGKPASESIQAKGYPGMADTAATAPAPAVEPAHASYRRSFC